MPVFRKQEGGYVVWKKASLATYLKIKDVLVSELESNTAINACLRVWITLL